MTRLSTLQYNMLRMFASKPIDWCLKYEDAKAYDQRPFRSMLIQQWIAYRPGRGFHVTRKGREAYKDFQDHGISRKNPNLPLTSYFDPAAYGLHIATKKKSAA